MTTLTPTQVTLLQSGRMQAALGPAVAAEVASTVSGATRQSSGMTSLDLTPWRDALTAALREVGPDSEDATVMEAADNLVKQLTDAAQRPSA